MVILTRFAIVVLASAGKDEEQTMLQVQQKQRANQSLTPASISNSFTSGHCDQVRAGSYGNHVMKCSPHAGDMYVQIKGRGGSRTTCVKEGLYPITTATQCKTALDALGLTADNVEAGLDDNYTPRPIDAYTGMKMHNYPNGRPEGCAYHASWPLVVSTGRGRPVKHKMSAAYVHTVSADWCGAGQWNCICTDNPIDVAAPLTTCSGRGGCDPLEVATDEFCAFFCGNADPGHVTGQCDELNPNLWGYLKKGTNKARELLCSSKCEPAPVNGVCVRSSPNEPVVYQDYCYTDAKAWNANTNNQMARLMSDFCTFVCDEDPSGATGRECKHKDNNNDVSDVCAQYCSVRPGWTGGPGSACNKNQNTKTLCTPAAS